VTGAPGRLTVVGTGIGRRDQIIPAALAAITDADLVLHQTDDPLTAGWLATLNDDVRPVRTPDEPSTTLSETAFEAMAVEVADAAIGGRSVCFATYGHPGVWQHAAHRSIELVRAAGRPATMIPGISALDCLIADTGLEIAGGCAIHDATAIVLHGTPLDPSSTLVVLQIGIFGNPYLDADEPVGLELFVERLGAFWPADHRVQIYEAPLEFGAAPLIHDVALHELATAPLSARSLLVVPPHTTPNIDVVVAAQLAARLAEQR
jgi:precorrin-6B methylase 1